uniref:F-box domain-containing protein n=1 Tax=Ditylenchus dipsaci TaxID=166011 RepID=A0A915DR98_9BILA
MNLRKRPAKPLVSKVKTSKRARLSTSTSENQISEKRQKINTGIEILPAEILVHIFELLSVADRMGIEAVCKRWQAVSSKHSWSKTTLWMLTAKLCCLIKRCVKYIKVVNLSSLANQANLSKCLQRVLNKIPANQLHHLDISYFDVKKTTLEKIAVRFKNLKGITISCGSKNIAFLDCLFKQFPSLEIFELHNSYLEGISFKGLPSNLKSLELSFCMGLADDQIRQITLACPNLECFMMECIHYSWNISSAGLNTLLQGLKCLRKIVINGKENYELSPLVHFNQLVHLDLNMKQLLTGPLLQSISKCSQLKFLRLAENKGVEKCTEQALIQLSTLISLEHLHLYGMDYLTDRALETIIESIPSLKALHILYHPQITESILEIVLRNCHQLKFFDLSHSRLDSKKNLTQLCVSVSKDLKIRACKLDVETRNFRFFVVKDK